MKAMKNKRFGVLIGGQDGTYCRQVVLTTGSLERAREIAKTIKGRPVAVVEVIPGRASGSGSMAGRPFTREEGGGVEILEERKAAMV